VATETGVGRARADSGTLTDSGAANTELKAAARPMKAEKWTMIPEGRSGMQERPEISTAV
jgi:hypothetical protein